MGRSTKFKYAYVVTQRGTSRLDLFGTDTKLTDDQLELKRRELNDQGLNSYHVSELALAENDGHSLIIRSSKHSTLPKLPLFTVMLPGQEHDSSAAVGAYTDHMEAQS
jgi:hypothetical protein